MDRLVIVTGASSGIGAAVVEAAAGLSIASVSRRPGPGNHLEADLAQPSSWPLVSEWISGIVDGQSWDWIGLVHCAAVLTPVGFAGEVDQDLYTTNVLLNSAAAQVIGAGFLHSMTDNPASGCLCMISSGAASTAYPGWSSYCASKAAVDQWCRTVGIEQEERGGRVRVMSVAPGVVDTAMQAEIRATGAKQFPSVARFQALHDEGNLQDPADVGRRLFRLITRTDLENGAVVDLRTWRDDR